MIESTRPRLTASVIVIFSRESESKIPPTGLCSVKTISSGLVTVIETLDVCLPSPGESSLINVLCSVMVFVVVLVVVIVPDVEDSGDRTVEKDASDDVGESEDNVDIREDVLGPSLLFDVNVVEVTYVIFEPVLESDPACLDVSLISLDASDEDIGMADNDNVCEDVFDCSPVCDVIADFTADIFEMADCLAESRESRI